MSEVLKLPEIRSKIEEKLRNLTGKSIYIPEVKVFSMACGCRGFLADLRGFQTEEAEVLQKYIVEMLEEYSKHLNLKPELIYARNFPGTYMVAGLTVRELCDRCVHELAGKSPRPDLIILSRK